MLVNYGLVYNYEVADYMNTILGYIKQRNYTKEENKIQKYLDNAENFMYKCPEGEDRELVKAHIAEVKEQLGMERHYSTSLLGIASDELYELEKIGLRKLGKDYQIVYDVGDMLDVILSEIFHLDKDYVRSKLEERAEEYDLTYSQLSRAMLCQNVHWENKLFMGIFFGLDQRIDELLISLVHRLDEDVVKDIFNREINLTEYEVTEEEKLSIFFYGIILNYSFHLVETILATVDRAFKEKLSGVAVLTSLGLSGFVYHSSRLIDAKELEVELSFKFNFVKLRPVVAPRGQYYNSVCKKVGV